MTGSEEVSISVGGEVFFFSGKESCVYHSPVELIFNTQDKTSAEELTKQSSASLQFFLNPANRAEDLIA